MKKTILFTTASRTKCLGINFTKEVKDLDPENYGTLVKEPEDDRSKQRYLMFMDLEN